MAKIKKQAPSPQTQEEALTMAKATQRPRQSKEQTKMIAQGIEKGIDQYKKQQKANAREKDKQRKKNNTKQRPKAQNKILQNSRSAIEPNVYLGRCYCSPGLESVSIYWAWAWGAKRINGGQVHAGVFADGGVQATAGFKK